jgi:NADPH-dependent 2,4-dienoyl-CoA reductase/sulfur reductase-like enzyme
VKHVIIGAGAAGITAAKNIRKLKPQDEIVVISFDDRVYSRCMLHKYIGGERKLSELSFVPSDFFEANDIRWVPGVNVNGTNSRKKFRWIPGVNVSGIDTKKKRVYFGNYEPYDRLLIATGSKSIS